MEIKELIGYRIKQLRRAKAMTQEELSEKMNISYKYLSSIERGKENPTLDTLIKLAQALEVEILELFNYSLERSPKELKKEIMALLNTGDKNKLKLTEKIIKTIYL